MDKKSVDSAGQPWSGRHFEPNAHVDDDGSADPVVVSALELFRSLELTSPQRASAVSAVVAAIATSRVLVPLIAEAGDVGVGAHGHAVDKTQELALVTVAGPNGQKVLPAFTSVEAMRVWRADARPVPVDARRAALAAVAEDIAWIVIDPQSSTEFVIRRPAVRAMAQGDTWIAPHVDPDLLAALDRGVESDPRVRAIHAIAGDPDARGHAEDLLVRVVLEPNLSKDDVTAALTSLTDAWADSRIFVERVDSMKIQVVAGE